VMIEARAYDWLERIFVQCKIYIQFSLEFERPAAVGPAIDETIRCVNAFRLRGDAASMYACAGAPAVHRIPAGIGTLEAVNAWMFRAHTPSAADALGAIAADDRRVVVNVSHACDNGRCVCGLLEHLLRVSGYGAFRGVALSVRALSAGD